MIGCLGVRLRSPLGCVDALLRRMIRQMTEYTLRISISGSSSVTGSSVLYKAIPAVTMRKMIPQNLRKPPKETNP